MNSISRRKFLKIAASGTAGITLGGLGSNLMRGEKRPNIIIILADDMGYSDIGCYGGEIHTPHINQLAEEGLRFSQFYNAARCSPTRASLLTGLYPHQAGMGWLAGPNLQKPGYLGHLNDQCITLAEALKGANYKSMMVGKWHVGNEGNKTTPWSRGFDRYFGHPIGAGYWDSSGLRLDGQSYEWPGDDFFKTEAYGTWASRFIEQHCKKHPDQPFFSYLAFYSPHWPLHAQKKDIKRYRGTYKMGWDQLRKQRFERMKKLGIIPRNQSLPPRDPAIPPWDSISSDEQDDWDHKMSVYAAQITAMDRSIGQVLDTLKKEGIEENTLILFLSDNGACAEGIGQNTDQIGDDDGTPPGGPDSFQAYLMPWANVSSTPFRMYKHWAHEGGIATPLIARWPAGTGVKPGSITDETGHVIDIMATCLDVAGVRYPQTINGHELKPLEGKSLGPVLRNGSRSGHERIYWEHEGHRAVREGRWKLVSMHETDDWFYKKWGYPSPRDFQSGWKLYDMANDRFEQDNLVNRYPDRVIQMSKSYRQWANRVGVEDWTVIRNALREKQGRFQEIEGE